MSAILFAADRSPTGWALALAVHRNADGTWCWIDGENREIPLATGESLYATAEDAKIAAHKRWQCSDRGHRAFRRRPAPRVVGVS